MAKTNAWPWIAWALLLAAALGFGWRAGRHAAATIDPDPATTLTDAPDTGLRAETTPKLPRARDRGMAARLPSPTLPDDLRTIAAEDFVRLLPTLKALAAQGRGDAAYAIHRHFDDCVGYRALSDQDIEIKANEARERMREMIERAPKGSESPPELQPEFQYDQIRRDALGLREQCAELGTVTGGEALDWAMRAIDLDDADAVRYLSQGVQSFGRDRFEAIRYAERVVDLQRAVTLKLDQRVARGDLTALQIYARALSVGGLLAQDFDYAYALTYARSMFPPEPNGVDFNRALIGLADSNRIRDIEAARARGIDIARECCGYLDSSPGR